MKNISFIIFAIILSVACSNDIEKAITTDLQIEANELFRTSLALEESLRYAFYTYEDYKSAQNDTLPGCPTVEISEFDKKIRLNFSNNSACPSQKIVRNGSLEIEYFQFNLRDQMVVVTYDNYQVKDFKVQGIRIFENFSNLNTGNRWAESFEDLLIIDSFQNSTKISGNYTHDLQVLNGNLSAFISGGSLEGRNLTGRPLKMSQITPRQYATVCIDEGFVMANSGVEVWEIFRTPIRSLAHTLTITQEDPCNSKVNIQLSDGRLLVYEQ